MQPTFLPNHPSLREKVTGSAHLEAQSMAAATAFSSKIKSRIAELEKLIATNKKLIQARKLPQHPLST